MCYITKKQIHEVLQKVRTFELSLSALFSEYGYNLHDNLGRRNALLSSSQEKELANVLRKQYGYDDIVDDGRPGQPDIVIKSLNKELECKLTSGSGPYSVYSLQTDYATLVRKKSLDYLYILTNAEFNKFCVIFFESLAPSDFFPPANGSRGKSQMNKKKGMKKATFLWGDYKDLSIENHFKWIERLETCVAEKRKRLGALNYRLKNTSPGAFKEMGKISAIIKNEEARYDKKIEKITQKIEYWKDAPPKFSYILKRV